MIKRIKQVQKLKPIEHFALSLSSGLTKPVPKAVFISDLDQQSYA
jgi:hypothetical protein